MSRKRYTDRQKQEARAFMDKHPDWTMADVAREKRINPNTFRMWVQDRDEQVEPKKVVEKPKRYRLIKETPSQKVGLVFSWDEDLQAYSANNLHRVGQKTAISVYTKEEVENNPEWFQPVGGQWKPARDEQYYYLNPAFSAWSTRYTVPAIDDSMISVGNCFKTEEQAKAAAEKVKALLLSLHEEAA